MYMLHFISHHVGHTLHNCYVSVRTLSICCLFKSNQKSSPIKKGALFALYLDVLGRQMCVVWRARAVMHFVSRKMSKNENKVKSCPWGACRRLTRDASCARHSMHHRPSQAPSWLHQTSPTDRHRRQPPLTSSLQHPQQQKHGAAQLSQNYSHATWADVVPTNVRQSPPLQRSPWTAPESRSAWVGETEPAHARTMQAGVALHQVPWRAVVAVVGLNG